MAAMVRQFSLKTYEVRGPVYFYQPDFVVRWTPAVGKGGFLSASAAGADPVPARQLGSRRSCAATARSSSIRSATPAPKAVASSGRPAPTACTTCGPDQRMRRARRTRRSNGCAACSPIASIAAACRPADDPILSRPWDRIPTTPPAAAATLRKECDAEITVAEGLEIAGCRRLCGSRRQEAHAQGGLRRWYRISMH